MGTEHFHRPHFVGLLVALFVLTMHATVLPVDVARAEQATVPLQHAMLSFGPQQNLGPTTARQNGRCAVQLQVLRATT